MVIPFEFGEDWGFQVREHLHVECLAEDSTGNSGNNGAFDFFSAVHFVVFVIIVRTCGNHYNTSLIRIQIHDYWN